MLKNSKQIDLYTFLNVQHVITQKRFFLKLIFIKWAVGGLLPCTSKVAASAMTHAKILKYYVNDYICIIVKPTKESRFEVFNRHSFDGLTIESTSIM